MFAPDRLGLLRDEKVFFPLVLFLHQAHTPTHAMRSAQWILAGVFV